MQAETVKVYLIPSLLDAAALETLPAYINTAAKDCGVFFVENERSARRFLKQIWREIPIDDLEWFVIEADDATAKFRKKITEGKNIGIISEAGCPGIADPGQQLISIAHQAKITVIPLVGPNSMLLALMASGLNGQRFQFVGYLPIPEQDRIRAIHELENDSQKKDCTQIFIETPYRNTQLLLSLLKSCKPSTLLCIAADLTGKTQSIQTNTIEQWKGLEVQLHKRPVIFLLYAGHR